MKAVSPTFFSLLIAYALAVQKTHWDGPQAKDASDVPVINAQGTTNWVKLVKGEGDEGADDADAEEHLDIFLEQTAMLNAPRTFADGDWVQIWTCTLVEPETTKNLCYHGEFLQKTGSEIIAIASVYETTATPEITGTQSPKEALAGTAGFKSLGSMSLA